MHCSVCGLDLPTTKQRNIIAGDNKNVATTIPVCDHCASYTKTRQQHKKRAKIGRKSERRSI